MSMSSPEVERDTRPLAEGSVTVEGSHRNETEPSRQPLSLTISASAEHRAPFEDLPPRDGIHPPGRPPPLDGFIKHYEIIRKLGQGGMGIVLLARDTKLGRLVAIKLLQDSGRAPSRLLVEALATARCTHDSIVVVYDVDEIDGHPYMVLEHLEGRTLRDVLSSGDRGGDRGASRALPKGLALDIVASVVRALAAAHERDVVHRDLKPENIMLLDSGQVKVLDFGLAGRPDLRARGGTLRYMAPEQWLGEDIDARTDLWAVGLLLHELLAGVHPLTPLTMEQLQSVTDRGAPMPRLRDVRPDLAALSDVVERCLRKRKEERFGSAEELLAALEPLREGGKPLALAEGELPFAGLSAFQEADAGRFFGREQDVAAVLGRLHRQQIVTVAAPSGAGKSSFVRAGVIPALKRSGEAWDVLVLRPGRAPLAALREALAEARALHAPAAEADFGAEPGLFGACLRAHCRARGPGSRALVFVDQLEELYTLASDPGERAAFIASLLGAADEASSPLRVVLAIRSDFLDRIADDRHFMAEVTRGLFLLPSVGREGLRDALLRPAEAAGHRFEDEAMITDILGELALAKTPLPLLQFSAAELWQARDRESKTLTRASYERLGGVAGSLSTHADAVFAALSPADQRLCQAIFLRLITPERTRAVVGMPELSSLAEDPAAAEALVQHLCGARLVLLETGGSPGSVTVELVHESLIQRWPRLARWLDESTADAQFMARLRAASAQWQAGGEAPGLLWRDRAAEEARAWYERRRANPDAPRGLPLGRREERYLLAVIALFERARRMRQRSIIGAFTLLGAVSVLVLSLAMRAQTQAKRADAEALRVTEQNSELERKARELALQALRGRNAVRMLAARKRQDDPTLVLALLREVEPEDIPKDWAELVSGALTSGVARDVIPDVHGPKALFYGAVWSPDGTRIVTVSDDKTAQVLSANGYQRLASLRGHESHVWTAMWSPDGKRVVTSSGDKTARIWNADGSGEPLVLRGHEDLLQSAAWSPDGKLVVTTSADKTARVFSAEDGRQLMLLRHDKYFSDARFSPDGKRIVTTAGDPIARVYRADGEGAPLLLRGHTRIINGVTWSPDGNRIATAGVDATARVWDAEGGKDLLTLRGHEDALTGVAWSRDGERIATASRDRTARIWRADGAGHPVVLRGHGHWIYTVDFSPDGRHLLTASLDRTLRFWDIDGVVAPTVLKGHLDVSNDLAWSPDGARIATASREGTARVWNADGTGIPLVLRGHTGAVQGARWSPDGRRIVTVGWDGTARIWSADGASPPLLLEGHRARITDVDVSPAGDRIVTASLDGALRVWRSDSGEVSGEARVEAALRYGVTVRFDREGRRILVTNEREDIYVWDLDGAGGPVVLGRHDAGSSTVQWSPDGSRVVSVSVDKTARIWDARGAAAPVVLRHESEVTSASWSPDGARIVTTSADATARVYRADGSGEPMILRGHADTINWGSFSPDGALIATASTDKTVRVWNADGSGQPFVLAAGNVGVLRVAFSPDGKRIAPRDEEKVVRVWPAVRPLSGPGDARLWRATSYCIPVPVRIDLLQVTEAQAREDKEACERRVEEARAAEGGNGGALPRDTVRP